MDDRCGTTNGGPQKVSPRKFSEKIALLNRSQAEGDAKFAEIIKQVHETRQQVGSGTGRPLASHSPASVGWGPPAEATHNHRQEVDELEEVYRELIKQCADSSFEESAPLPSETLPVGELAAL